MKRHDLEPISLVFGLLFLLVGVPALLGRLDLADSGWHRIWPYPVIGLGLLIVVLAIGRDRRSHPRPAEPTDEEPL